MPCDYRNYPPDWKEIRTGIVERANHRCEFCGVKNHEVGVRDPATGTFYTLDEHEMMDHRADDWKPIRIVLTVAHLDHDTRNNVDTNLKALCQRCHLRYDAKHHARNAANTRHARKATGDLFPQEAAPMP